MRRQPLYFYNDTRTAVVASRSPVNIKQTDRGCFTALRRFVLRSHGNRSPRTPRKCYHDMSFLTKAYLTANIQCHLSRRQSRMWRVFFISMFSYWMWLFYVIQVHKRFPIWWQWSNALVRMISNEAIYCVCAAVGLFVLADYFTNSCCRKAVAQWASVLLESAKFYVLCCPVTQETLC